jgi:hypothetical protein
MGAGYDVSCSSCEIGPFEIAIGVGMLPDFEFFELRPTWCARCQRIDSHEAVKPLRELREMLKAPNQERPWSIAGGPTADPRASRRATLDLLVRARQRPSCSECKKSVVWISATELEEGTAACPACEDGTLTVEGTLMWD